MLREIVRMAVPELAELCIVDLVHDGALGETTAYATNPRTLEMLHDSRVRYPLDPEGPHPVAVVARTGRPHLQHEIGAERLRAFAVDEQHLELMAGAGYATSLAVPLIARGRTIGVLSFMRFGGAAPYADDDIEIALEVARRAALALDNARLFAELRRTEGQLEAVLANLAAAVTVQAPDGTLVYVNQAARGGAGLLVARGGARHAARAAGRRLRHPRRGRAALRPARAARAPRAGRRGVAPDAHAGRLQGDRRGALVGDQGHAGPRRARRGGARGQHRRGRDRRAPGRAPAALPVGGEHARLLLAGHRRHARQGGRRGGARTGRLVLRRRPGRARRRAARGPRRRRRRPRRAASACATPSRWTPTTPARRPTCCAPGAASSSASSTTPRPWRGPAATRSAPPCCGPATRARRWSSPWWPAIAPSASSPLGPRTARGGWARTSWRWPTSSRAAPASRWRTRACTPPARTSPPRCNAACCRRACPSCRASPSPRAFAPPGRRARWAATSTTSSASATHGWSWWATSPARGPTAATITSLARYTMRTAAMYERSPGAVLARLNAALAADPDRRQICTAVCARIEPAEDGTLRVALARGGHPPPFLIAAAGGAEAGRHPWAAARRLRRRRLGGEPLRASASATPWSSTPTA